MALPLLLSLLAFLQPLPTVVLSRDPLPAPTLSQNPRDREFLPGDLFTLTCSLPWVSWASGYRFYQKRPTGAVVLRGEAAQRWLELTAEKETAGSYTCAYWRRGVYGEILSSMNSSSITIRVADAPSPPALSVGPLSRAVSEGLPLLITCTATGKVSERRFHFYKDGSELLPWEAGSEMNTTAFSTSAMNISVLRIPRAWTNHTGEFTCGYEDNVNGRWIPSPRSQAVNVTVKATRTALKSTNDSEPRECTWSLDPAHENQGSKANCAGAEEIDQDSEVTYAHIVFSALGAHTTQSKTKATPAEEEHVMTDLFPTSLLLIPSSLIHLPFCPFLAHLPAPRLSLDPSYTKYIPGELVTLTCSAPGHTRVLGYRFFYPNGTTIYNPNGGAQLEIRAEAGNAGSYTCAYWRLESNRAICSGLSNSVSVSVTDSLPAPQLTVSPQHSIYITGEVVTLICSASGSPTLSGVWLLRNDQEIHSQEFASSRDSYNLSLQLLGVTESDAGCYTCESRKTVLGREIPSELSEPIFITVTDPLPQPVLVMSEEMSEGLSLLITCGVSGDTGSYRFHFYKDGAETVAGDIGSEIDTSESISDSETGSGSGFGSGSVSFSGHSIPWDVSDSTGEFTCGYEKNVRGRWLTSPKSQAVTIFGNIPVSARRFSWVRELAVGGSFFLINSLIFLISHCCF
ncbi:uncharacterized protein LOC142004599 [Carettochelys insculpta]|uniref:uncharacterized protein LOC142004599 n=1 Tax=Carettochelys insculpta TaxID=44489 RepID=UPI003EBA7975